MTLDVITREEFTAVVSGLMEKIHALETKAGRKYVPVNEAAQQLGVSAKTITRRYRTITQGRRRYVLAQDLEA